MEPYLAIQAVEAAVTAGNEGVGSGDSALGTRTSWYAVGQGAWRLPAGGAVGWQSLFPGSDAILYVDTQADLYLEANYSHVVACAGHVYLGGFAGVLRSDDGGRSWLRLDVLSSLLTALEVGPSLRDPNGVRLIASAYRAVSHVGEFNIDALKATGAIPHNALRRYWPKPTSSAETQWKADLKSCTYFYLKYSPTFRSDQLMLAACTTSKGLLRSTNAGKTWAHVSLPHVKNVPCKFRGCVSESAAAQHDEYTHRQLVHTLAFSPAFSTDRTVFAGGFGVGIARSVDGGVTFITVWDGCEAKAVPPLLASTAATRPARGQGCLAFKAVRIAISPSFATDRRVVAIIRDANTFHEGYLFVSMDGGSRWTRLTSDEDAMEGASRPRAWLNVAVGSAGGGPPAVLAVEERWTTGRGKPSSVLTISGGASGDEMRLLPLPGRASGLCRDGFGHQGFTLADDFARSGEFSVGCTNGGVFVLRLNMSRPVESALELLQLSEDGPWQETSSVGAWSASIAIHPPDNQQRCSMGNTLSYSPHYARDGVIFAASYYSIVASFDRGRTWRHVYRLSHTSTNQCEIDPGLEGCSVCQHTKPPSCVRCMPGYVRSPYKWVAYTHDTPELSEECLPNSTTVHEDLQKRTNNRLKMRRLHVKSAASVAINKARSAGLDRVSIG